MDWCTLVARSRGLAAVSALLAGLVVAGPGAFAATASGTRPVAGRTTAVSGMLYGVAATSGRNAWAVGAAGVAGRETPLILRWSGAKWVRSAVPAIAGNATLSAVAARTISDAWAVGSIGTFAHEKLLILHWNGTKWIRSPAPVLPQTASLAGVAALSASNAWAVGSTGVFEPSGKTLILHWNGRKWRVFASGGSGYTLNDVAFSARGSGWAVGNSGGPAGGNSYIARWNGTSWMQVKSPSPGGRANILQSVAITSTGTAWTAGAWDFGQLVLRWNGSAWKRVPAGVAAYVHSISVASGKTLWAVGQAGNRAFIEKWNGTVWKRVTSPGTTNSDLFGVIATSGSNAWAVGCSNCFTNPKTLILRWNGTAWK